MKIALITLYTGSFLLVAEESVSVSTVPGPAPARFLSEDLDDRNAAMRKSLSIASRERGPFGLYQNPARTPVISQVAKEIRKTPFSAFINDIRISVINSREKEFLVGARIFRLGQVFPIIRNGERISVRVESIGSSQVAFRNLQSGEVALRRLDTLPDGVTTAGRELRVRGVTSRSRGEAEPLRLESDSSPPLP